MHTYGDHGINAVALVNEELKRIIVTPATLPPLVDDAFDDHVQTTAGICALDDCGLGEPGKRNGQRGRALLYHLEQMETFVEQGSIVRDFIAANSTHGQLEDNLVDAGERVG